MPLFVNPSRCLQKLIFLYNLTPGSFSQVPLFSSSIPYIHTTSLYDEMTLITTCFYLVV